MYDEIPGVPFDEKLGVIIPIDGFTTEQVKDNIVKYPHLFRLSKEIGGVKDSFYKTIEIDGILQPVAEVWDSLEVSKILPRNSEFIKEYAVRLYLMERDILGKQHNFELCGSLMPFLTLFTTPDDYIQMGYTDVVDMARQCVIARVSYKQTRNPIMRRAEHV